jgi:hypothetical protein
MQRVFGVVFGAMSLVVVVIFLVVYGPWPAVAAAVMYTLLVSNAMLVISSEAVVVAADRSMPQPPGNPMYINK